MFLIIDSGDCFAHSLYHCIQGKLSQISDSLTADEIRTLKPAAVLFSSGAANFQKIHATAALIQELSPHLPILGIGSAFHAIALAFGGKIAPALDVLHGKSSLVFHRSQGLFKGLSLPFDAGIYSSHLIMRDSLPASLIVEADTVDGRVMAIKHHLYPCYGLQFHPESILTPEGAKLLNNFVDSFKHG